MLVHGHVLFLVFEMHIPCQGCVGVDERSPYLSSQHDLTIPTSAKLSGSFFPGKRDKKVVPNFFQKVVSSKLGQVKSLQAQFVPTAEYSWHELEPQSQFQVDFNPTTGAGIQFVSIFLRFQTVAI